MTDITKISRNQDLRNIGDAKARANIADSFDVTKNYSIGDLVLYDGLLYRFTSQHGAGAWNSSHVTAATIVEREVLYNANNIILERTGNIYHYYTSGVCTKSNLNTATSAISAYAPLINISKPCTFKVDTSASTYYVTLLCRFNTNGEVLVMDNQGNLVSNYAYLCFDFIYFK